MRFVFISCPYTVHIHLSLVPSLLKDFITPLANSSVIVSISIYCLMKGCAYKYLWTWSVHLMGLRPCGLLPWIFPVINRRYRSSMQYSQRTALGLKEEYQITEEQEDRAINTILLRNNGPTSVFLVPLQKSNDRPVIRQLGDPHQFISGTN